VDWRAPAPGSTTLPGVAQTPIIASMPPKVSAGILLYRHSGETLEVFLVHPGGPFWAKKSRGAWSLPKGELAGGEDPLDAARREFTEETGFAIDGQLHALQPVRQSGGKTVLAWAVEGDCDPAALRSNLFELEWPPKSGKRQAFPEVDRAAWFSLPDAREQIVAGQVPLLDELDRLLS
jgi:predicted NUDIX family NTP pyrophosphohydrolase